MVEFTVTKPEALRITRIAQRAVEFSKKHGLDIDYEQIEMDITACHCNGCPLDLQKLLDSKDSDFGHDVLGIRRYIDRSTGKLTECFDPRCSMPDESEELAANHNPICERRDRLMAHDCPESCDDAGAGYYHLGVAGVLGVLKIERCEACERFGSDEEAEQHLRRLIAASEQMLFALQAVAANELYEFLPDGIVQLVERAVAKASGDLPTLLDAKGTLQLDTNSVTAIRKLREEWDDGFAQKAELPNQSRICPKSLAAKMTGDG